MLPELIVKFSINNQISIGLQNVYRKPTDVFDCDYRIKDKYEIARKIYERKFECQDTTACESFEQKLDRLFPPLDITKKTQRGKKANRVVSGFSRLPDGSRENLEHIPPFGAKQGQKLRESGAAIDKLISEQGGSARIVTLTLAGDTKEAFECLAANSKHIVNRLLQELRRGNAISEHYFYVWEYQKRGALHLHMCIWSDTQNKAARAGAKIVKQWYKVLQDIQKETGVDMFVRKDKKTYTAKRKWQSRNEPMRKSAGGYFSKYASKASDKKERQKIYHLAKKYPPSRFWGSSQSVKNIIKNNSFSYSFESHRTEISESYYEKLREILSDCEILSYGSYEFKKEKEFYDISGNCDGSRILAEGFRQNYYYSQSDFEVMKDRILAELGAFG